MVDSEDEGKRAMKIYKRHCMQIEGWIEIGEGSHWAKICDVDTTAMAELMIDMLGTSTSRPEHWTKFRAVTRTLIVKVTHTETCAV